MEEMKKKIWTDGSGNGVWCYVTEDGLVETGECNGTSNEAEYRAIVEAIDYCTSHGISDIKILSDSKLCVEQLNHRWHINKKSLRDFAKYIWDRISEHDLDVVFKWIPRDENRAGKVLG